MKMFKKISALLKKRKVTSDAIPRPARSTSPDNESSSDSSDSNDLSDSEEKWTKSDPKKQKNGTKNGKKNNPTYNNGQFVKIVINDSNNTHIGHNYFINDQTGAKGGGEKKEDCEREQWDANAEAEEENIPSDQLEEAINSTKEVTEEELMAAKGMIGNGLPIVCDHLGVLKSRMEQLLAEYRPREEGIYRLLLEWKQRNGRIATVGILCESLWKAKEYDAAESIAYAYTLRRDK